MKDKKIGCECQDKEKWEGRADYLGWVDVIKGEPVLENLGRLGVFLWKA